jgi:hypothetical protein
MPLTNDCVGGDGTIRPTPTLWGVHPLLSHEKARIIGFACTSPGQARAFHGAGVANGGKSVEDPPGWREGAAGKLYLAYLRDPSGNKICALHRG